MLTLDPLRAGLTHACRFALCAPALSFAVRAADARQTALFQLTVRTGVAYRAVALPIAVRAGVALHAEAFLLAVRTGGAHHAATFHLAVRAGAARSAAGLPLAVETWTARSCFSPSRASTAFLPSLPVSHRVLRATTCAQAREE